MVAWVYASAALLLGSAAGEQAVPYDTPFANRAPYGYAPMVPVTQLGRQPSVNLVQAAEVDTEGMKKWWKSYAGIYHTDMMAYWYYWRFLTEITLDMKSHKKAAAAAADMEKHGKHDPRKNKKADKKAVKLMSLERKEGGGEGDNALSARAKLLDLYANYHITAANYANIYYTLQDLPGKTGYDLIRAYQSLRQSVAFLYWQYALVWADWIGIMVDMGQAGMGEYNDAWGRVALRTGYDAFSEWQTSISMDYWSLLVGPKDKTLWLKLGSLSGATTFASTVKTMMQIFFAQQGSAHAVDAKWGRYASYWGFYILVPAAFYMDWCNKMQLVTTAAPMVAAAATKAIKSDATALMQLGAGPQQFMKLAARPSAPVDEPAKTETKEAANVPAAGTLAAAAPVTK